MGYHQSFQGDYKKSNELEEKTITEIKIKHNLVVLLSPINQ